MIGPMAAADDERPVSLLESVELATGWWQKRLMSLARADETASDGRLFGALTLGFRILLLNFPNDLYAP
jgi:hypothetical protein